MSRSEFDHVDWYDRIAERTGGYRKTWESTVHGRSGEDEFVQVLFGLLEPDMSVLDAGCGSGEFTLEVAKLARQVTGFDFAGKMIEAARENAREAASDNLRLVQATTRDLPFSAASFDLVYSRRGPTSILLHADILRPGGWMLGVHSERLEVVRERLAESGLRETRIEEFEALETFPSVEEFAAFWSRIPGHPNYLDPENSAALSALVAEYSDGERLVVPEKRFVWRGRRPDHRTG